MKKTILIIGIVIINVLLVISLIFWGFNYIQKNPIDAAAMNYLWENETAFSEYGSISHIGRKVYNSKEKKDGFDFVRYTIETESHKLDIGVCIKKEGDIWVAYDHIVERIRENAD